MNKKKQSEPKNEPPPVPKIDPKSNPKRNRTGRDSQDGGCFGFFFCLVLRVWFVVCTSGATPISHGTRRRVPRERHQSTETRNGVEKTGNKKKQSIERASFFFVFFFTAPSERWKWTTTGRSDRRPVPGPKSGRCCLCCCACSSTNCSPDLPARCHLCGRANRFGPIFSLKKNKGSDGFP